MEARILTVVGRLIIEQHGYIVSKEYRDDDNFAYMAKGNGLSVHGAEITYMSMGLYKISFKPEILKEKALNSIK